MGMLLYKKSCTLIEILKNFMLFRFTREETELLSTIEEGTDETGDNVDYSTGVPLFSGTCSKL